MRETNNDRIRSEFGQDIFVLEMLGWKRDGFFLDSGASDGVQSSNTHLLEFSYDWKGICIEPNKVFFEKLVKNRKSLCLNYCLYDKEDYVDFLEHGNDVGGIMQEYHPSHLDLAKVSYDVQKDLHGNPKTIKKLTRTVGQILKESNAPQTIDYWSLDTEGSELTILKSFPFDEYSFRIITVEHNHFPVREEIKDFLEFKGYQRIKELEVDDCYMQR
jgi:FkbM family methyltransferase